MSQRWSGRYGRVSIIIPAVLCGVILLLLTFNRKEGAWPSQAEQTLLLHFVERSKFEAFVTEPGDIVSSSNVEVRCEVESRGSAGVTIVSLCEEGTEVETGDLLVQFDDSVLQNELIAQQIVVAKDKSALIQAESNLSNAERTLREYVEGLFQQEVETLESAVFVTEEDLRRKELELASHRRMASKGILNQLQVTAGEFALEKSRKDVAASKRALDVFKKFTRERKVGEFTAEIEKQKANVEAAKFTQKLSNQKLLEISEQIDHCTIRAPAAGQVVYANERQRGEPVVIEEGSQIRFNQMVARLPDIKQMQVDVKINESHINRVSPGMRAEITLDADPEKLLFGEVKHVAPYPFPMRWHGAPLEYGVEVAIKDPPPTIRPGLRAKVKIFFEAKDSVLQIPLAAVIAHEKSHYCLVRDGDDWEPTPIIIGPNNNNQVVVIEGITEGDQVALTPFRFIQRADLPAATKASAVDNQESNRNSNQLAEPPQQPNQATKEFTATEIGTAQADAGT
ncbi:MAG: efflux RND transporter periplasmic adaptor subunit [Rubripirellula sp.]